MPKKPPDPADFPAPHGLSPRSTSLWHGIVPTRGVSPGRLAMIEEALRALDRADQARAIIDAGELTTTTETTGAVHVHPAYRIEKESRAMFAALFDKLSLEWDCQTDGRSW